MDYQFSSMSHIYSYLEQNIIPRIVPPLEKRDSILNHRGSVTSVTSTGKEQPGMGRAIYRSQKTHIVLERLPSFISLTPNLSEVQLSHLPNQVLETLSGSPSLLKRLPLNYNIDKILERFPPIWKKVS